MEKNQKINCTVESCKYNNKKCQECELGQIVVTPIIGCDTKQPDESMCSSYKYENKTNNKEYNYINNYGNSIRKYY